MCGRGRMGFIEGLVGIGGKGQADVREGGNGRMGWQDGRGF